MENPGTPELRPTIMVLQISGAQEGIASNFRGIVIAFPLSSLHSGLHGK